MTSQETWWRAELVPLGCAQLARYPQHHRLTGLPRTSSSGNSVFVSKKPWQCVTSFHILDDFYSHCSYSSEIDGKPIRCFGYQMTQFWASLLNIQTKCSRKETIYSCLLTSSCTGYLSKDFFSKVVGKELLHMALHTGTIPKALWRIT